MIPADLLPLADSVTDWIEAIATAITAGSVGFLLVQIRMTSKHEQAERTRQFQERYLSDGFSSSASRTIATMTVDNAADCVAVIEAWSNRGDAGRKVLPRLHGDDLACVHDIDKVLGLFEDMGTAYNLGQLDPEIVLGSFAKATVQVLTTSWWFIAWLRDGRLAGEEEDGKRETTYEQFQKMCRDLRRREPSLVKDRKLQPAELPRILCLPKTHDEPLEDERAWHASRRLSGALSSLLIAAERSGDPVVTLSELAERVDELAPRVPDPGPGVSWILRRVAGWDEDDQRPGGWDVILVPRGIDQPCNAGWRRQRVAASELGRALSRLPSWTRLDAAIGEVERRVAAPPDG
jgi:hypothetical protein